GQRELLVRIRRLARTPAARVLDPRQRRREPERRAPRAGSRGGDPGRLLGRRRRREVAGRARRPPFRREAPTVASRLLLCRLPRHLTPALPVAEQLGALFRRQLLPTSPPSPLVHRIHPINRTRTDVTQLHRALPGDAPLPTAILAKKIPADHAIEHQLKLPSNPDRARSDAPAVPRPVLHSLSRLRFSSLSRNSLGKECFRDLSAPRFVRYFALPVRAIWPARAPALARARIPASDRRPRC